MHVKSPIFYMGNKYDLLDDITLVIRLLKGFAFINGLNFKKCVEHAYNEIKDRDIKIIKGVAVK